MHVEQRDAQRAVDVPRLPRPQLPPARAQNDLVEPQVEIEPNTNDELCVLDPLHILRLRLVVLWVSSRRNQAGNGDEIAPDHLGQALEICRGCDNAKPPRTGGPTSRQNEA